jgi:hypothetical protein
MSNYVGRSKHTEQGDTEIETDCDDKNWIQLSKNTFQWRVL